MKVYPPDQIRERAQVYSHREEPKEMPERGQQGAILGKLNRAVMPYSASSPEANFRRRLVLALLFREENEVFYPLSSKELNAQQWGALSRWQRSYENGSFVDREAFSAECAWVYTRAKEFSRRVENAMEHELELPTLGVMIAEWKSARVFNGAIEVENTGGVADLIRFGGGEITQVAMELE